MNRLLLLLVVLPTLAFGSFNCPPAASEATCIADVFKVRQGINDVALPPEDYKKVVSSLQPSNTDGQIVGTAVAGFGIAQAAGLASATGSFSGGFSGMMNIFSGLKLLSGSAGPRPIYKAYVPQSVAQTADAATAKIEEVIVNAWVKALPGATTATLAAYPADGYFIRAYRITGGVCDKVECWLWGNYWSEGIARSADEVMARPRLKLTATLMPAPAELGGGDAWTWQTNTALYVYLVINPNPSVRDKAGAIYSRDEAVAYPGELPALPNLFVKMSENLPSWVAYLATPTRHQPFPAVYYGGKAYLFIAPATN